MGKVASGLTMSLDGFIAGPNDGPENPLGDGGMRLFDWYWRGDTEYEVPSGPAEGRPCVRSMPPTITWISCTSSISSAAARAITLTTPGAAPMPRTASKPAFLNFASMGNCLRV